MGIYTSVKWGWERKAGEARRRNSRLLVIQLQVHPIMDFIISQRHVVLKNRVPLFKNDLIPPGASLGSYQFLQVPDGVIGVALDADFPRRSLQTTSIIVAGRLNPSNLSTTQLLPRTPSSDPIFHGSILKCICRMLGKRHSSQNPYDINVEGLAICLHVAWLSPTFLFGETWKCAAALAASHCVLCQANIAQLWKAQTELRALLVLLLLLNRSVIPIKLCEKFPFDKRQVA